MFSSSKKIGLFILSLMLSMSILAKAVKSAAKKEAMKHAAQKPRKITQELLHISTITHEGCVLKLAILKVGFFEKGSLILTPEGAKIHIKGFPLDELFTFVLEAESENEFNLESFLPTMPEHKHGTLHKLEIEKASLKNRWLIKNVQLHMQGLWKISVKIKSEKSANEFDFNLQIDR